MNRETLQPIVDYIARSFAPTDIFLFGSVADGRAGPTSDVDLLVIAEFREPRGHRGRELAQLRRRYAMPLDIQLYTRGEFEREARDPSSFAAMVDRHGVRLH